MPEPDKNEPHRVGGGGQVHPCVTMAMMLAQKAYASRMTSISPTDVEQMLDSVCVGDDWNNPPVDMRALVLMATTALLFGSWLEQTVVVDHFKGAAAAAENEARAHAVMTSGLIANLSSLADQLANSRKHP